MKTSKKVAILVAIICIIAGAAVSFTAFARMDYDITRLDTFEAEKKEVVIEDKFNSICVDDSSSDIIIKHSADKQCKIVFNENNKLRHTAKVENGTLNITTEDERNWRNFIFNFNFHKQNVEIYLPEKEYAELNVQLTSGEIKVDNDFYFKKTLCKCSSGDIEFRADASDISAECSSGDITISGTKADTVKAFCTSGDVTGENISCKDIDTGCTSGDIELKNVVASGNFSAETTSGDIELKGCDGTRVELEASSGDIEGSLLTGKRFRADSGSGDIDVPDSGVTDSECCAKTSSGDIELWISGEK